MPTKTIIIKNIEILKKFIFYSIGNFVLKSITSSIMLITITFLTTEEYGLLSLLNNFINIFPIILNLGLRQAFGSEFYHLNSSGKIKMLNDIIGIYLFISVPILIISFLNINFINQNIFVNQANNYLISIALVSCFLNFFAEFYYQVLRYQCKTYSLTTAQFFVGGITILTTILFVYFLKFKISGVLLANLFGLISIIIYAFYRYIKVTGPEKFRILHCKKNAIYYLKLGFPFVPNILFAWILSSGNKWFLAQLDTMQSVGIYSFADNFCQLFNLIILYPLSASYVPHIFRKFAANKEKILETDKSNLQNMYFAMGLVFILITLGFLLLKILFIGFIPVSYHESLKYIWFLLLGQIFLMGSYFATAHLLFSKKNYLNLVLTIIAAIISSILNFVLIPVFGIWGCVISSIISYFLYWISVLFYTKYLKTKI